MIEGKLDTTERKISKKEKIVEAVDKNEEYKKWAMQIDKAGDYWLEEERKLADKQR
jgi:hypothetical protein